MPQIFVKVMKFRPFSVLPDGFSICLYILIAYVASAASVYVLVNFLNSGMQRLNCGNLISQGIKQPRHKQHTTAIRQCA
jgi:hypothetical protein